MELTNLILAFVMPLSYLPDPLYSVHKFNYCRIIYEFTHDGARCST